MQPIFFHNRNCISSRLWFLCLHCNFLATIHLIYYPCMTFMGMSYYINQFIKNQHGNNNYYSRFLIYFCTFCPVLKYAEHEQSRPKLFDTYDMSSRSKSHKIWFIILRWHCEELSYKVVFIVTRKIENK